MKARQIGRWMLLLGALVSGAVLLSGCSAGGFQQLAQLFDNLAKAFGTAGQTARQAGDAIGKIADATRPPAAPTQDPGAGDVLGGRRGTTTGGTGANPPGRWAVDPEKVGKAIENLDQKMSDLKAVLQADLPTDTVRALQTILDDMGKLRDRLAAASSLASSDAAEIAAMQARLAQMSADYEALCARAQGLVAAIQWADTQFGAVVAQIMQWKTALFGPGDDPGKPVEPPAIATKPDATKPDVTQPDADKPEPAKPTPPAKPAAKSVGERVSDAALNMADKYSESWSYPYVPETRGGPDGSLGWLGCAQVVSTALKNAGQMDRTILNCPDLMDHLEHTRGWKRVNPPPWKPGDVLTWGDDDHIGIVVANGNSLMAMSNSSSEARPVLHGIERDRVGRDRCRVVRKS